MIAYLCIALSALVFSTWTWNRCARIQSVCSEPMITDYLFALAVVAFIYGITHLPK